MSFYLDGINPNIPFPNNFLLIASINSIVTDINKIIQEKKNINKWDFKTAIAFYKCDSLPEDPQKKKKRSRMVKSDNSENLFSNRH